MKKNSVKNIRINSEVQREMSQIIREDIKDPRVHPLTSVMAVEVTPDLKFAKIFIKLCAFKCSRVKYTLYILLIMQCFYFANSFI